jgi:urease accessory protein UreF
MTARGKTTPRETGVLVGDPQPLLERVGWPKDGDGYVCSLAASHSKALATPAALARFLADYRDQTLLPIEWPAIIQAHRYASLGQVRELLELDRSLAAAPELRRFASASVRVGQRQLNRLRPLRDHRLLRRYRLAIDEGQAHGWHTVVFGVSLAVFSLPLRQGLAAYSHNTLGGFIGEAGEALRLTMAQAGELHHQACAPLSEAMKRLLPGVF